MDAPPSTCKSKAREDPDPENYNLKLSKVRKKSNKQAKNAE